MLCFLRRVGTLHGSRRRITSATILMIRTLYNNQKKRLCCSLSRFPSLLVCRAGRDVVFVVGAKRPLLLVSQSSGDGVVASGVVLTGSPVSSTPLASRVVLTAGVLSASVSASGLCVRAYSMITNHHLHPMLTALLALVDHARDTDKKWRSHLKGRRWACVQSVSLFTRKVIAAAWTGSCPARARP